MTTLPSQFTTDPYSIDPYQAINWDHPLCQGVRGWWQVLPLTRGGLTWYDLTGRHHGTLTNMDPATDWVTDSPKGGWGSLQIDATQSERIGTTFDPGGLTAATTATWIKFTALSGNRAVGPGLWAESWMLRTNGTALQFYTFTSGFVGGNVGLSFVADRWYHVVATYDGATMRAYVDGVIGGTTRSQSGALSAGAWRFGEHSSTSDDGDDYTSISRVWDRALSASEVAALYDESRRGYPGMLRWQPTTRYFLPSGGGATVLGNVDTVSQSVSGADSVSIAVDLGESASVTQSASAADAVEVTVEAGSTDSQSSPVSDAQPVGITAWLSGAGSVSSSVSDAAAVAVTANLGSAGSVSESASEASDLTVGAGAIELGNVDSVSNAASDAPSVSITAGMTDSGSDTEPVSASNAVAITAWLANTDSVSDSMSAADAIGVQLGIGDADSASSVFSDSLDVLGVFQLPDAGSISEPVSHASNLTTGDVGSPIIYYYHHLLAT
jgi:hypothetical protein